MDAETKPKKHPLHHHINILLMIKILLVIVILMLIKPAFTGYMISQEFKEIELSSSEILKEIEALKSDLIVTDTNLDSCKSLNKQYLTDLGEERNKNFECSEEKNSEKTNYEQTIKELNFNLNQQDEKCKDEKERDISDYWMEIQQLSYNLSKINSDCADEKESIRQLLDDKEARYDDLENDYLVLIENSANNICCKLKVDNKDIDSFVVTENRIVCTTGENDKISC